MTRCLLLVQVPGRTEGAERSRSEAREGEGRSGKEGEASRRVSSQGQAHQECAAVGAEEDGGTERAATQELDVSRRRTITTEISCCHSKPLIVHEYHYPQTIKGDPLPSGHVHWLLSSPRQMSACAFGRTIVLLGESIALEPSCQLLTPEEL